MINYYRVLGLHRTATIDEIKVAYRANAKRHHPDLNPGNEQHQKRFLEINEAYDVLSDPVRKKAYDNEVAAYLRKQAREKAANEAKQSAAQQQSAASAAAAAAAAAARQRTAASYQSHPKPPYQPPTPPRPEPVVSNTHYTSKQLEEIKKLYQKQLAVIKSKNKEDMRELKKRLTGQIDAHKKHSEIKRKQLAKQYKEEIEKARSEAKKYKADYRRNSFNAGMAVGIKEAYADSKKTIDDLKEIIDETNSDLEALRAEKQKLEKKYIEAKAKDDGIDSSTVISLHREKMEVETEFAKVKSTLRAVEAKLAKKESEYSHLVSEHELLQEFTKNNAQIDGKELRDTQQKLEESLDSIKSLEESLAEREETIDEQAKTIEDLRQRVSELTRYTRMFGQIEATAFEDDEDAEQYRMLQAELAKGTYYGVLGLPLYAVDDEIDAAFDKMTVLYKGKRDYIDKYIEIIEAYNVLSDEVSKAEYDKMIDNTNEF